MYSIKCLTGTSRNRCVFSGRCLLDVLTDNLWYRPQKRRNVRAARSHVRDFNSTRTRYDACKGIQVRSAVGWLCRLEFE